ncbi:transmembrane protein 43-like [Dendronephthya gigantea]|uniref:transmembrane protein 43-like n=1 Tax=Dendronephthya gigantea TaxID=151771 RepID=UPI00106A886F|nr:transmembrane protein 43-like [Dendronephthya gigantea]
MYRGGSSHSESSICAAVLGVFIVLGAFPLLYWNEGRAVKTAAALDEGLKYVIHVDNPRQISRTEDGKLIHVTGVLQTDQVVSDPEYMVAMKAVKLKRQVEMFQWVEHKSERKIQEGGETRVETTFHTVKKEWRSGLVNSALFDRSHLHENPSSMIITSKLYEVDHVYLGAFELSEGLVNGVNNFKPFRLNEIPATHDKQLRPPKLRDGILYHSRDPMRPEIGDLKVSFSYAGYCGKAGTPHGEPMTVSIVAKQTGHKLGAYETDSGYPLELLYPGKLSAKAIFEAEHASNVTMTWLLRGVGWLMFFLGFIMMTSILTTLVSWIPIVRDIIGLGVTLACVAMATSFSLVVIAIGWIRFRPMLGCALLAAAAVPFILSRFKAKSEKKSEKF